MILTAQVSGVSCWLQAQAVYGRVRLHPPVSGALGKVLQYPNKELETIMIKQMLVIMKMVMLVTFMPIMIMIRMVCRIIKLIVVRILLTRGPTSKNGAPQQNSKYICLWHLDPQGF